MPRSTSLEQVAEAFGVDVAEFYATEAGQPLSQLDRIETMVTDLHVLFFGGEDEPGIGLAARLLGEDGSPPPKAVGE